ncbi:hypothetical protein [Endozoicomonas lisbonensis]|uniref:Uncharacterized protein n=1 Tax=Endozoicomonas lisbonensis TaxID=3120522 RepID=A0ABV2SEJ1_9GAMM
MSKIDGNSGVTPPQQPADHNKTEKAVGTLGDKTVSPLSLDENLQQELQTKVSPDIDISDRFVSHPPLNKETLSLLRNLVREKSWEGVREALDQRVKSLEHFDQLAQIAPDNLPLEAQQLIINRYAGIATERIVGHLTNLKGSAQEQLDSLNLYFIRPDSPHNAVKTVCRSVSDDFMQASKFQSSLGQSLKDQLETRSFGLLKQHLISLDRQVAAKGSPEQIQKNNWQINQRNIEVRE